jgi:hypothetical protein
MHRSLAPFSLILLCVVTGCGESPYVVAPVRGKVLLNNKPLPQGGIMFAPIAQGESANAGKTAVGRIQEDGTYTLTTYDKGDGAVVGEHWVTIVNHDEENLPDGVPSFARIQVPEKKVVVAGKENQIDITLSSDEIKKYREDDR